MTILRAKEALEHTLFLLNTASYYQILVNEQAKIRLATQLKQLSEVLPENEEISDEI